MARRRITRHDRAVDRRNLRKARSRRHHGRRSGPRASFNRKHPRNRFGEFVRKR